MTQDNLRDVIGLRMQLAREVLELAEEHRDDVWARLRSRISDLEDGTEANAETESTTTSPRRDGRERRRRPAKPMYADEEATARRPIWSRTALAYVAAAAVIAATVAAVITLS
jgi:hypothetical protein